MDYDEWVPEGMGYALFHVIRHPALTKVAAQMTF